jgi:hypothetical protein
MFINKKIVIVLLNLSLPVVSMDQPVAGDVPLTVDLQVILSSSSSAQDALSPWSLTSQGSNSSSSQASALPETSVLQKKFCKGCLLAQAHKHAYEKSLEFVTQTRIQHYQNAVDAKNKIIASQDFKLTRYKHLNSQLVEKCDVLQTENDRLQALFQSLQSRLMAGLHQSLSQKSDQASTDNSVRSLSSSLTTTSAQSYKYQLRSSLSSSSSSLVSGQSAPVRKNVRFDQSTNARAFVHQQAAVPVEDDFMALASTVADPYTPLLETDWFDQLDDTPVLPSKKRSKAEEK